MKNRILIGSLLAATAFVISVAPAHAKLKCKDVKGRWQICGDAKPFKSFTVGVGIRFNKKKPGLASNPPKQGEKPGKPAEGKMKALAH